MTPEKDRSVGITIMSVPEHLPIVRAAVGRFCGMVGFDEDGAHNVSVSVDEALTNIIRHAYGGSARGRIDLLLAPLSQPPGGLQIRIRDYGKGVDASSIRPRNLGEVRPGGLGVHIMKEFMDRIEYSKPEGQGTVLIMEKHFEPPQSKEKT